MSHDSKSGSSSPDTENKLRSAMVFRAESVEPGSDALHKIEARMGTPVSDHKDRYRFLAVAAALLVVAGIGVTRLGGDRGEVSTVSPTASPVVDAEPPSVGSDETPTTLTDTATETTDAPDLQGFLAGPVAPTREEAASLFVDLIGFTGASFQVVGNTVVVYSPNPDGNGIGPSVSVLDLSWVESRQGFTVTRASSPDVVIESPVPPSGSNYEVLSENSLAVTGTASGYEDLVGVYAISVIDAVLLDSTSIDAGESAQPGSFDTELSLYGMGRAWIIVQLSSSEANTIPAFAAVPVSYDAPLDATSYTVYGVPLDDAEGGINVRNAPGVPPADLDTTESDGEEAKPFDVVATLANGTTGIHRRSPLPAVVDGRTWWDIEVGDVEGWVNAAYLVADTELDRVEIESMALEVRDALNSNDPGAFAGISWSRRRRVWVGWSQNLFLGSADELTTDEFWNTKREVIQRGVAESDGVVESLRELMNEADYELLPVEADAASPYPADRLVDDGLLAGLTSVRFANGPDSAWPYLTVYFEPTEDGPRVAAVVTEVWIP